MISSGKKFEIIKVTQENMFLYKRIKEKESAYSTKQWKMDWERSRGYYRNRCLYPTINFCKTTSRGFSQPRQNVADYTSTGYFKDGMYDRFSYTNYNNKKKRERNKTSDSKAPEKKPEDKNEDGVKTLHETSTYIKGLGDCKVTFVVQKQE